MIKPVVSEGFLSTCAPIGCSALVGVFEADDVVDVDEVTGFVSVETYGGIGLIAAIVGVFMNMEDVADLMKMKKTSL